MGQHALVNRSGSKLFCFLFGGLCYIFKWIKCEWKKGWSVNKSTHLKIGSCRAVGNVSGYRCVPDCRSRCNELESARYHTFAEMNHEINSMVILLPSTDSFKKGCCQLQAKVIMSMKLQVNHLFKLAQEKSVVRWNDMTIAVDLGRKATKQTIVCLFCCFTSQVNSYGHCGTVSSPNHTFFLGKLEQAVNQYFVHILSLVTDNNPSWMIQRKGGEWP